MKRLRQSLAVLAGAAVLSTLAVQGNAYGESASGVRPEPVPLSAELEAVRAEQAVELYGSPEIRPREERSTSQVAMGDSEMSGEGVGNYEPDTDRDGNWCHRSYDQALYRTGIETDEVFNIACSGAASPHLVQGSGQSQWDEMNQGDNLAVKARNTNVKLIYVAVGANDTNGVEFGPVMTDCVTKRVLFQGECWPTYTDDWSARVEVTRDGVANAVASIKNTMTEAGYLQEDFELVFMSYPTPMSPDVEDNPDFPGWYGGGCLGYLEDMAFGRNKAVPLFERGVREAVLDQGARYLDLSRLFDGHSVCEEDTWARGLYIDLGAGLNEHALRQSFHPNYRGHGAFAECVTQFYDRPDLDTGTCVDVNYSGEPQLYEGLFSFQDVQSGGYCMDAEGYNARYDTSLVAWDCHGGRNQGFRYDEGTQTIQIELSQARCVDIKGGDIAVGTELVLWKCTGTGNQRFIPDGGELKSAVDPALCVAFPEIEGDGLVMRHCGAEGTSVTWEDRAYSDPVGYGHDDWIGSMTY
ncbi:ricin-type beta-trefoil lectin domain protein [Salininema proteolyticum]|uniref:Ricin-type beta-trefoil lectin domain protein n=1 Tax=Salininema proteolyticum TaxID=1607685 RepID=A0ABV8U627_9ACTN